MSGGVEFNFFKTIANELSGLIEEATEDIAEEAVANIKDHIEANGQISDNEEPGHVHMIETVDHVANSDGSQTVFVGAPYAIYPNYGTRYQPANPFWEPGLQDTHDAMDEALQNVVDAIKDMVK